MSAPVYTDFDLAIEQTRDGFVAIASTLAGERCEQRFTAPFSVEKLEIYLLKMGQRRGNVSRGGGQQEHVAKELGRALFDAAFGGDVGVAFRARLEAARGHEQGLRLRLRLDQAGELADLPWEYLFFPDSREFIALSKDTPIIRYHHAPAAIKPLTTRPPLRVLVMISDPVGGEYASLDVEREWEKLRLAVAPLKEAGLLTLERLPHATLSDLQDHLRRGTYHVFHFIGHGIYRPSAQEGVLVLEDARKRPDLVTGHDIGAFLRDKETLRLVVLNACEGARSSARDPFSGVAQSLLLKGIPAVIAMQFEISDEVAIELSHMFYTALADGYPIDAALVEARKSIFAKFKNVEWGTPVLYLRSADGRIFDLPEPVNTPSSPLPSRGEMPPNLLKYVSLAVLGLGLAAGAYFGANFYKQGYLATVRDADRDKSQIALISREIRLLQEKLRALSETPAGKVREEAAVALFADFRHLQELISNRRDAASWSQPTSEILEELNRLKGANPDPAAKDAIAGTKATEPFQVEFLNADLLSLQQKVLLLLKTGDARKTSMDAPLLLMQYDELKTKISLQKGAAGWVGQLSSIKGNIDKLIAEDAAQAGQLTEWIRSLETKIRDLPRTGIDEKKKDAALGKLLTEYRELNAQIEYLGSRNETPSWTPRLDGIERDIYTLMGEPVPKRK